MPRLSSSNSKNISAAKMNKKYDSCAAHITRVATNIDFWAVWSEFLSKFDDLEWIFIEIGQFLTVWNASIFCFRRTKKMSRDVYNRRQRRDKWIRIYDEYASTTGKSGFTELQNAYAQKCGRTSYAVGNNSQLFPIHLIFLLGGGTR